MNALTRRHQQIPSEIVYVVKREKKFIWNETKNKYKKKNSEEKDKGIMQFVWKSVSARLCYRTHAQAVGKKITYLYTKNVYMSVHVH